MLFFLKRLAARFNLSISQITERSEILRLIEMARPTVSPTSSIRLGSSNGGGYVIPDDLAGLSACVSPGVGTDSEFELAMSARGIPSFLADYSVEGPAVENQRFVFEKKYISNFSNDVFISFNSYLQNLSTDPGDWILQMDIEGHEYVSLLDLDESQLNRFRIIVLELHGLEMIGTHYGRALFSSLITRLTKNHFVTHLHANNYAPPFKLLGVQVPSCLEICLIRKDRIEAFNANTWQVGAHELDKPCVPSKSEVYLASQWFHSPSTL